jgi:hypothetical protein
MGDTHSLKERTGKLPLLKVLGLVVDARFTPPADKKQHGDRIDIGVRKGKQGVDGVADAGILHVHQGDLSGCQIETGGKGDSGALIYRRDMIARCGVIRDIGAKALEQGIGDAGKKIRTAPRQFVLKNTGVYRQGALLYSSFHYIRRV